VCHLNTCPVGVATQDPALRARFRGTPDHVITFLMNVAEEARELMARLGARRLEELIGRAHDFIEMDPAIDHWKAQKVDLSLVLAPAEVPAGTALHRTRGQEPMLENALDWEIMRGCAPALEHGEALRLGPIPVRNIHRSVGSILSGEITRRRGGAGLAEGTIELALAGSAGQSFGAWLAPGVTLMLKGETNDYTGKGLSGGIVVVRPPDGARFHAEENQIVGNTVLYGATSGRAFFRGLAGERFAVRNSGADAVVEGVGDHGCEYMTGGRVVVLGPTGRNFGAGMSGGVAYVWDVDRRFNGRANVELVELEPVNPADRDADDLRSLIAEHQQRTGSLVARNLLAQWERSLERFVRVMPRDYKAALEASVGREQPAAATQAAA
jgi:glutamate synthase domain-containing protein 3